jgi:hypothetical protein
MLQQGWAKSSEPRRELSRLENHTNGITLARVEECSPGSGLGLQIRRTVFESLRSCF